MQTEHTSLGQVYDGRTHHGAEDSTVADGEGAASHVFDRELVISRL
jgi:hypothetical protein